MSDEIDIEEHDVMENPSIKRIFPDLTVIKKEINQYYEALNAPPEPVIKELSHEMAIPIGVEPKPEVPAHMQNSEEVVSNTPFNGPDSTETRNELSYISDNIIILGSKPSLESQKKDCNALQKEPQIVLKNVNDVLNRSKRFCKDCLILFPKSNLYNLHRYNVHLKNTPLTTMGSKITDKLYKCNICDRCVSNKANLRRHIKNLHGGIKPLIPIDKSGAKDVSSSEDSKTKVITGLDCFHCQQLFPTQASLIEHLYDVLDPKKGVIHNGSTKSTNSKETNKSDDRLIEDERGKNVDEAKNYGALNVLENNDKHFTEDHSNYQSELETDIENPKNIPKRTFSDSGDEFQEAKVKKKKCILNSDQMVKEHTHIIIKVKKRKCKKCTECFNTKKELRKHVKSVHKKSKEPTIKIISCSKNIVQSKETTETKQPVNKNKSPRLTTPSLFYKCFVCSKYNITFKYYLRHLMNDHKIKEVSKINRVRFDPQCKFCPSKLTDINCYNVHLYKSHREILKGVNFFSEEQGIDKNQERFDREIKFALKSILFKCIKCDLYFLSAKAAVTHSKHLGVSNNWKCSECLRLFKYEDMLLHLKQHLFSQTFTVHHIGESAVSRVLYRCTNCTVHYSEEKFLQHYLKCDFESPNSLYCKVCDILMNRDDMDFHALNHKYKMHYCDYTIIESNMIDNRTILDTHEKTREKPDAEAKLVLHFCHTCQCFVSNIQFTRKVHFEGRCGHMAKTVCKECGLVFTMKTHSTHKELHKKKQINLQDYLFYDLAAKKQIIPPIPVFPSCNNCGVHFLRNCAIKIHACQEQDYITCNVCFIKLTEHAYKLHMPFHNYFIQNANTKNKELALNQTNDISCDNQNVCASVNSNIPEVMIFYTCKSCQITVNTYEKVVQHCQDHYDCKEIQLDKQKCQNCDFLLLKSDYERHNMLHLKGKYNKDFIEVVDFDPFYFRFNNDFWTKHIFAYVAEEQIGKVLSSSIFKYECRLKMEEIQSGSSSLMLYKCNKCGAFVEPDSLYMHAELSCDKLRKHPCSFCDFCFVSLTYRISHEKEHESMDINLKTYKIISFNKNEHKQFNKIMYDSRHRYILYECRNCEEVVDKFERNAHKCDTNNLKICSSCGLLLHRQNYDLHFIRHEELERFNAETINVVMFGKLLSMKTKQRSTFSGNKYDHTIFKCIKCGICLSTKKHASKHVCIFDNSTCECTKCGLYFSKLELKYHSKVHENNLGFDQFTTNVINFNPKLYSRFDTNNKQKIGDNDGIKKQSDNTKDTNDVVTENIDNSSKILERIYKCDCGLHFLEELSGLQHASVCKTRIKISKQNCSKCDLLFTPGELFNHLLKHHGDKKLQFKFDIVFISKMKNKTSKALIGNET